MTSSSADARQCSRGHPTAEQQAYCSTCGEAVGADASPVWKTALDAIAVVAYRPHLSRTLLTAAVVGTILFAINQLDVVLAGDGTALVWGKVALTYVVPFIVSNVGILIATHRPSPR